MMLLKPARLRAARLMLPMMLSLVALSGLTLGLAPPVWAQSGGSHQVGDRLAGADKGGKTGFREISWDDLIPADWNPEKFLADLELDDLQDNDPRAMELMQRMREENDFALVEPVFFTTSSVGAAGPDVGQGSARRCSSMPTNTCAA